MGRLSGGQDITRFRWVGSEAPLLDTPTIVRAGRVVVGRYGGNRGAGANSNEDGALVWCAGNGGWEFAVLLDAHFTAQSAELVIDAFEREREAFVATLAQPVAGALSKLQQQVLALFRSPGFRASCQAVEGEASCLIFARKEAYLWWLSIGDCVGYVFNEEQARFGQFAVNQRVFYEWVGQQNTFDLAVPCYTSGTLLLRDGWSTLLLATDGLFEWGSQVFADPVALYRLFASQTMGTEWLEQAARTTLERVHAERARDSATLLVWRCEQPVP
ncbi:MAG TPA: protein phosphatase 2C domain-containing protein [Ktedonobacterales bacterium]